MVGWPAAVLVVAVVLVIAGMVRWVVADQARTRRLVALIRAVRRP